MSEIARLSISRGPQQPFRGRTPSAYRVVLQTRSGAVLDAGLRRLTALAADRLGHEIADVVDKAKAG